VSWKGYDNSHDGWQERETFSPDCDALLEEAFRVFRASDAAADAAAASPTAKKRKRVQQQQRGDDDDGQPASKRVAAAAAAAAAAVVVVVPPPAHVGVSMKGLQWRVRRRRSGPITPPSNPGLRMAVLEAGMSEEEEEEEIATGWGLGAAAGGGGAGAGGYVPPLSGSQEF
jgi:hypothetical protein